MFTDCPSCRHQFKVRARHLSAAAGEVRCGFCGHQFNALKRLRDEPLPASSGPETDPGIATGVDEPVFELPEVPPAPAAVQKPVRTATTAATVEVLDLFAETPPQRARFRTLWAVLLVLLLLAIAAQVAWFQRDYLLQRYPRLLPAVETLCARFRCSVLRNRDLTAIKVVDRDVRLHPRFQQALLVNASFVNRSRRPQPYPTLQVVLYDTAGHVTAYRNFTPTEYLDRSIPLIAGMGPDALIHVVLELAGPTDSAVSFELGFL